MTTHFWMYSVAGLLMGMITLALFRRPNSMGYLEKADARFIDQARDDSRRRAAIAHLSQLRRRHYGLAILCATVLCLSFLWYGLHPSAVVPEGAIAAGFGTVVAWLQAIKSESELRLLKLVDEWKQ